MNLSSLFDHPAHRRLWLLLKAMESRPLADALKLAQAVEAFIAVADDIGETGSPRQNLPIPSNWISKSAH
ncbi:MAG TPA: hypothetical protein VET89_02565 [Stellaceae bacterium]|nr:hypothetical protein [Stellaceae bacterium]